MYQYPYGNQYNQYQQPQQRNGNLDWIMVSAVADVEKVTVQPNQKAWIMVQNEPVFALRTADQMGLVQTDMYRFEKYSPEPKAADPDYVTKAELEQAIAALTAKFGGMKNEPTSQQARQDFRSQQPYGNITSPEIR